MYWLITIALWVSCIVAIVSAVPVNHVGIDAAYNGTFPIGNATTKKPIMWASVGGSWIVSTFLFPKIIILLAASYNVLLMPEIPTDMANIYKDDLRRGTQAWLVQMSHNDSWVPSGRTQEFNFAASSSDANSEAEQLKGLPSDMILLQSGNGQAGFAEISYTCVYAPNGIEVGRAYQGPKGMCLQAIKNVIEYIEGPTENQLFKDIQTLVPATFQD